MENTSESPLKAGSLAALQLAIIKAGGKSALAEGLGVSYQVLSNWCSRGVPAERCPDVERLSGVRCEALRPDVNWSVLRATAA